jgi:glycosyltransferase involved in cell wall biosynthesis
MNVTISVVIPSFNRAEVLPRALHSVLSQTRSPDQVILVDDGSTDGTSDLVAREFPTVTVLLQENRGVSSARNLGVASSTCKWIAFLDSDDEWLPEKLQVQLNELTRNDGYRVCHCDELWIRRGVRVNPMKKHRKKGGWIFRDCLPLCVVSPSAVILERALLESIGGFDESLPACEDYDLWLRIAAFHPVLFVDMPLLVKYGGHDDQLSARYWGMDRFRISALENIIEAGRLNSDDYQAACRMLVRKARIFCNGARKRNRVEDVRRYEAICARYSCE